MALQEVISELNRIKVAGFISDYAIGGAVAAHAYIEPAATVDVDVFVVFGAGGHPLSPLAPIWADLIAHGAKVEDDHLVIGTWPVQFLADGRPLLAEAIASARTQNFGDQVGKIMGPEHLVAIALATGRVKDVARVAEFIRYGAVNLDALRVLLERFGLTERWETFKTSFPTDNV